MSLLKYCKTTQYNQAIAGHIEEENAYYSYGLKVDYLSYKNVYPPLVRDSITFHQNNNRLGYLINKPKQQNPNSATYVNTVHEPYLHR